MLSALFCDEEDEDGACADGDSQDKAWMSGRAKHMPKPPLPRGPSNFVGLENQGATCYLNALLQCLYHTPELREGLFSIDPFDLGAQEEVVEQQVEVTVDVSEDVENTCEEEAGDEPDEGVVGQLVAMGFLHPCAHRCVLATHSDAGAGAGADPFSVALEYALEHSNDPGMNDPLPLPNHYTDMEIQRVEGGQQGKKRRKKPRMIPLELQRLFSQLQGGEQEMERGEVGGGRRGLDCRAVSTQELTKRGFQWTGMDGSVQHDAHELNRLLIDALEKSLKHTSGEQLCPSLYRGLLANQIECLTCHTHSEREEPFYDLLLQVLGAGDMFEALSAYVQPELLAGENRYECSVCQCRRDSHRRVVLKTLPPVLTFSCQRFDIDRTTWQRVKVTSAFRFPLAFSMLEFTGTETEAEVGSGIIGGDVKGAGREGFVWLEEVCVTARRVAKNLVATYGEKSCAESGGSEADGEAAAVKGGVRRELADPTSSLYQSLRREMLDPQVVLGEHEEEGAGKGGRYQLFGVIVHHGSAHSGHYSAFIRDVRREGVWQPPLPTTYSSDDTRSLPSGLYHVLKRFTKAQSQKQTQCQFILENSPLHIVLTIVSSSGSMSLADLQASLGPNLGGKELPTTLPRFLQHHEELFAVNAASPNYSTHSHIPTHSNHQQQLNTVAVRSDAHYTILPPADFNKAALDYSTDELLAFCCAPSPKTQTHAEKVSTEWQTSGSGKKNKKKNKRSGHGCGDGGRKGVVSVEAGGFAEIETATISPSSSGGTEETPPSQVEESLAHLLLTTYHGAYFHFNDSDVTAVSLAQLADTFQGSSSAYILIYRDLRLDRVLFRGGEGFSVTAGAASMSVMKQQQAQQMIEQDRSKTNGTDNHSSNYNSRGAVGLASMSPRSAFCPPYWQRKVDLQNAQLRLAREEYATFVRTIQLTAFFPTHFLASSNSHLRSQCPEPSELFLAGREGKNQMQVQVCAGAARHSATGLSLTFDSRESVDALRLEILRQALRLLGDPQQAMHDRGLKPKALTLLRRAMHLSDQSDILDFLISPLQVCPNTLNKFRTSSCHSRDSSDGSGSSMFLGPPLVGGAQVGDVLSNNAAVFLWGRMESVITTATTATTTISRTPAIPTTIYGFETYSHPPKQLLVTFACVSQEEEDDMPSLCTQQLLWFSGALSMGQVCTQALQGLLNRDGGIDGSIDLESPAWSGLRVDWLEQCDEEGGEVVFGKTSHWEARSLFSGGKWQLLDSGSTWEEVIFDDFKGREICFDIGDKEKQKPPQSLSLGVQEASRRNRLWTMQIKYEDETKCGGGGSLATIAKELKKAFLVATTSALSSEGEKDAFSSSSPSSSLEAGEDSDESLYPQPIACDALYLEMDCDAAASLTMLKRHVLWRLLRLSPPPPSLPLHLPPSLPSALLDRLHFRTGHNLNVGLLDPSEELSLKERGLYHNATLRLQVSEASQTQSLGSDSVGSCTGADVVVRFCLVTGNDAGSTAKARSGKHNPQQPGSRSLVLSLPLHDPEETLADLKQRALALYESILTTDSNTKGEATGVAPQRRMRKTNWADECTDELLFEEEAVAGSSCDNASSVTVAVTVGSALRSGSLKQNELLLLEEGNLPDRDALCIEVFLWPPSSLSSISYFSPPPPPVSLDPMDAKDSAAVREEFEALVLALQEERVEEICPLQHPDLRTKLAWLPRLGRVKCRKQGNLEDLYAACYEALAVFHHDQQHLEQEGEDESADTFPFVLPPSVDYLLLRDLETATGLPGKVHRLPAAAGAGAGASPPLNGGMDSSLAMIGKGGGGKNSKKKGGSGRNNGAVAGGKTLQRLGFRDECEGGTGLVLQLLETPQCTPPPGQVRVWVQRAEDGASATTANSASGTVGSVGEWPPREVLVSGGATPSFGHLLRSLLAAFQLPAPPPSSASSSSSSSLLISKHVADIYSSASSSGSWATSASWVPLTPGLNNVKKRAPENLLAAPYSLKDGSFLVIRHPSSSNHMNLTQTKRRGPCAASAVAVDRKEDMFARFLHEVATQEKQQARKAQRVSAEDGRGGVSAASGGRRKETEVMLRIGDLDLNFSDDEDDNLDGGS